MNIDQPKFYFENQIEIEWKINLEISVPQCQLLVQAK